MKRLTHIVALIAGCGLLLAGCGLFSDPMKDVEKRIGVPVQSKTVPVSAGTLTFYRYARGKQCGTGFLYDVHGVKGQGGFGEGPCGGRGALDAGMAATFTDQSPFTLMFGEVLDPGIVRVTVLLKGETKPLEAQVVDGWWYLFLDGQLNLPERQKVTGYHEDGTEIPG